MPQARLTRTQRSCAVSRHFGVSLVTLGAASFALAAHAQEAPPPLAAPSAGSTVEEIVVTAQKRSENLQTTPIAITAVTAAQIEARGLNDVSAVAKVSPSVVFNTTAPVSGVSSGAIVFIRGVGQSDFQLTTEPGVGTYVDGVYESRSVGGVLDVLDVQRIEVLRGPQGTLFGRNTIGGAISLVTQPPANTYGGKLSVTAGDYSRLDVRASVDLPISDRVRSNIAFSSKTRDGYDDGLLDNRKLGDENRQTLRARVDIDINPKLTADFEFDASRIREQNAADKLVGISITAPGAATSTQYVYDRQTGQVRTQLVPTVPGSPSIAFLYNVFDAANGGSGAFAGAPFDGRFITSNLDSTYATGTNGTRLDVYGGAATFTYKLPLGSLKSITAVRQTTGTFNRDADGSPLTITQGNNFDYYQRQISEELQWTGDAFEHRLLWATGLYYFDETGHDLLNVTLPPSFGDVRNYTYVTNRSYAAYGQATWRVTDALSLTFGDRYTRDEKDYFVPVNGGAITNGTLGIFGPPGTDTPFFRPGLYTGTYDNNSIKAVIDYRVTGETFVYGSYSEGFKSGGFNTRYLAPVPTAVEFQPELLTTYEAGFKTELLGRRLRFNADVFHSDYDDIQLVVYRSGAPLTENGGTAEINGVETEIAAKPMRDLDLSFGLGYLDAHYTRVNPLDPTIPAYEQVTKSDKLPKTPELTMNAAAEYRRDLPIGGAALLRADWQYSGRVENDAQNSPFLTQGAYNIFNAAVGYEAPDARWSITGGVTNLTDKRIIVSGDSNYAIGFHEANFNRPREFFVTLKTKF